MIKRTATEEVIKLSEQFKAIAIVGPRQSGKTTLSRTVFPEKKYVSLENPDVRLFATEDPRGFLAQYPEGAIFDEAQRVPQLFSYLQQILDESSEKGRFILTGSNNFLLQETISQSLAGRIGYLFLLPFSIAELNTSPYMPANVDEALFKGGYPPIFDGAISPQRWLPNYIRTYVERDVRQLKNINDLSAFERFLRLCAGRVGQLLNMNSLAVETGVDGKTIAAWLGVLESSFIVYLLRPHHNNFNKRLVKMPKLYFYDTGLVSSLLGINQQDQLVTHPLRGALFENFVIAELVKERYNKNEQQNLYFWRDNVGNEMDVVVDKGLQLFPIEIKAGRTVTQDFFKNFKHWAKMTDLKEGMIIYGGDDAQRRSTGIDLVPWNAIRTI